MKLHISTSSEIEKSCWKAAKIFFFMVIVGTMINATIPAVSRIGKTGPRTLLAGTIRAVRTESLSVGFHTKVARVLVREGQAVKAGDPIAELDSPELRLELESAERRLQLLRLRASQGARSSASEYSREQAAAADRLVESIQRRLNEYSVADYETSHLAAQEHTRKVAALVENRLATGVELDVARRTELNELRNLQMARQTLSRLTEDLDSARAQQRMARIASSGPDSETRQIQDLELEQAQQDYGVLKSRLEQLHVVAPIDGVVIGGLARDQETIFAGSPVARIASLSELEVEVPVSATIAKSVVPGTRVDVRLPSDPPLTVRGTVMYAALATDVRSGGHVLRVGIPGAASYSAFVGMEATVDVSH
ncbi:MAG: efflux RND transporter periplasmic adaptor subunit [Acidobacteria bacterium]|nr:efflux RND transporter periplasmic adaptor subunit [Acidobacteriota bacterium]